MVNQVHTYSFINTHNYLDEPARPMTKSQENSIVAKNAGASNSNNNNSHRAIT